MLNAIRPRIIVPLLITVGTAGAGLAQQPDPLQIVLATSNLTPQLEKQFAEMDPKTVQETSSKLGLSTFRNGDYLFVYTADVLGSADKRYQAPTAAWLRKMSQGDFRMSEAPPNVREWLRHATFGQLIHVAEVAGFDTVFHVDPAVTVEVTVNGKKGEAFVVSRTRTAVDPFDTAIPVQRVSDDYSAKTGGRPDADAHALQSRTPTLTFRRHANQELPLDACRAFLAFLQQEREKLLKHGELEIQTLFDEAEQRAPYFGAFADGGPHDFAGLSPGIQGEILGAFYRDPGKLGLSSADFEQAMMSGARCRVIKRKVVVSVFTLRSSYRLRMGSAL
jgi:hypothetical protein